MASTLPALMRAVQWSSSDGGIEKHMQVNNVPLPKGSASPPKDSTLVKVSYVTLNPVDYKFAETPIVQRLITRIPGTDFAGTVVSTTLPHLKPGDAVCGRITPPTFGTLAEYALVAGHHSTAPIPEGVDPKDVAALGVAGLTAYQAIVPAVKAGDKVFINGGSGGVGVFAIQVAKNVGCHVTATCSGPNVEFCKSLGADEVIDYRTTDVVAHLKRQGTQFALLFDTVGNSAIYYSAHHYLKPEGSYNTVALNPTSFANMRDLALMFLLPTFLGGGQRPIRYTGAQANLEAFAALAQWVKEGKLKTPIDQEYTLDQTAEAFAKLKSGRTRGKIIIKVGKV